VGTAPREHFLNDLNTFFEKRRPISSGTNMTITPTNWCTRRSIYLFMPATVADPEVVPLCHGYAYKNSVYGISGNDYVGQMSAWYVLSAIGFYPVSPVNGVYIIDSLIFDEVHIRLGPRYYSDRVLEDDGCII
jgi:putative alpha-1,2-mannosidase